MSKKKKTIITCSIIAMALILMLLGILSLITKSFTVEVILHIYLHLLYVPLFIMLLKKRFQKQLTNSMNKALILCGCTVLLDIVVVDAVRFVLSNGISTVLFLPICLPACFMIIMFYSCKDTGRDKYDEKRLTYIVGIPLLLLSLYFEVLSFIEI